jgi:hypothetical protein
VLRTSTDCAITRRSISAAGKLMGVASNLLAYQFLSVRTSAIRLCQL